jgi:preprotein translocase subunit SecG
MAKHTPLWAGRHRKARSRNTPDGYRDAPMEAILSGLQIVLAVIVIVLVLLHSGKDAGLSGAFGVGSGGMGSGSLVERNLTRWTIGFGIAYVVNVLILLKI